MTYAGEYATAAYAAGWAASCGPMTDRAKAGAVAIRQVAESATCGPEIVELALHLGKLEGIWATVYKRREELVARHLVQVGNAWAKAVAALDLAKFIRKFRNGSFTEADPQLKASRLDARQAALGLLSAIHYTDQYQALQDALADAIRSGRAEGQVVASRVHAARATAETTDEWSVQFDRYYGQLELLDDWPGLADRWVQKIIDGAAADLGARLAALARDGASYQNMLDGAQEVIGATDIRALTTLVDYAMGDSLVQGSLDLYANSGVKTVDWLDAGDGRVCQICADNATGGPYTLTAFPACPAHPFCRCSPAPTVAATTTAPEGA